MAAARSFSRIPSTPRRGLQRGIGLVGFIVGIVVGLAIALGVAVYVTKVPTPFTDKGQPRTAQQQAEEEARLKSWDPNAGLQGKRANNQAAAPADAGTAPATTATAKTDNTEPAAAPATTKPEAAPGVLGDRDQELAKAREEAATKAAADQKTQEEERAKARREARLKAEREAKAKAQQQTERANASADPIGALVESRTAKPEAAAKPAPVAKPAPAAPPAPAAKPAAEAQSSNEPFVYFVQAGAYGSRSDADAQRARLGLAGMSARVTERDQAGRTVYRVRLGPFNSKAEADRARSRVEGNGMDAALVRVQR